MTKCTLVYITTKNVEEARCIGRAMVEQRLAACANIVPGMQSIYRWEGNLCEDDETVLLLKTTQGSVPALIDAVKSLHSYDCPCIVCFPLEQGSPEYLAWLVEQVEG